MSKEKTYESSISRVLSAYSLGIKLPAIYLGLESPLGSIGLPPSIGRAPYRRWYTRPFHPQCILQLDITISSVGSYPTFSPLPLRKRMAVIFCYAHLPHDSFQLGSVVLFVAQTFLSCSTLHQRHAFGLIRSYSLSFSKIKAPKAVAKIPNCYDTT